jgi:two-component system, cell cycle response regulator DivK
MWTTSPGPGCRCATWALPARICGILEVAVSETTILLVEDDRDSREVYGSILRHPGYRVLEATDGVEGVLLAHRHLPDLIVMDLGLPRVDGWTATDTIKSDPVTSHIPVVAITVHLQALEREHAERVGCDSFLEKPGSPSRLVGEVTRILHQCW